MKTFVWLVILGLLAVGAVQLIGGALRRQDFDGKLHDIALQVGDKNQDDIKRQIAAEATKLHLQVVPSDITIQYAPTSDMTYAQRMVSRIGTIQNHRATINVDFTQSILFLAVKHHAKGSALIQSAAEAKRAQPMPE